MIWKKTRRTKATAAWLENTDPIRLMTYHILVHFKYLVIALIFYVFALTIGEWYFTIDNVGSVAKGEYHWNSSKKQLKVSNPKQNLESLPEITNL